MAPETDQAPHTYPREHVLLDADGHARDPLPTERAELEPEQRDEDDRLQAPGVRTPVVAALGVAVMAFVLVALGGLFLYFHSQLGAQTSPAFARFPDPRLETNIDPRSLPAVQRGGAEIDPPVLPQPSPAILKTAMAQVLARGPHAYDPLPDPHAPGPPQPQGATAAPAPPTPLTEDGR